VRISPKDSVGRVASPREWRRETQVESRVEGLSVYDERGPRWAYSIERFRKSQRIFAATGSEERPSRQFSVVLENLSRNQPIGLDREFPLLGGRGNLAGGLRLSAPRSDSLGFEFHGGHLGGSLEQNGRTVVMATRAVGEVMRVVKQRLQSGGKFA
jgi:hypothetical protein